MKGYFIWCYYCRLPQHQRNNWSAITWKGIYYRWASCQKFSQSNNNWHSTKSYWFYDGLFNLMLRLHVTSTSNGIALVGDNMKKWFITDGHHVNFDNQTTTDIQLSLMVYEGLFHLMLLLPQHQIKITLFGDHIKSDLLLSSIMSETPTIKQRLTFSYVVRIMKGYFIWCYDCMLSQHQMK